MNPEWFGPRLRELRVAAGLSREDLAQKAGMKVAGIANLEQGRTNPAWETVVALCAALGCGCDAFLQPPGSVEVPGRGRPVKIEEKVEEGLEDPPAAKSPAKDGAAKGKGKNAKGKGD